MCENNTEHIVCAVFDRSKDDDKFAPSFEDTAFLKVMEQGFYKDEENSWRALLPFRMQRRHLCNNKAQAWDHFRSLQHSFNRKPEMKKKIIQNGHVAVAPPICQKEKCWYLTIFGVYHPKKLSQTRVVFDSSTKHDGVSLNNVFLMGLDLNNSLLGVFISFRQDSIAKTTDIQQMFHCFVVRSDHRNFFSVVARQQLQQGRP